MDSYRQEIAQRLDAGSRLQEVEAELIDPSAELSDDDRAALWLFAWSYRDSQASVPSGSEHAVVG